MKISALKNIGPGPLVAAAFIGPGTVTVCTLAGVGFGYALLWAMVLSIVATVVLQEMSARLGIITQKGLSEVIRTEVKTPLLKILTIILILSAIVVGNAAYEAGNISGGVLGLETLVGAHNLEVGSFNLNLLSVTIGVLAFVVLIIGNYKILERALIFMVILMSISFIITAIITKPNISEILSGIFIPRMPGESLLTVVGLIGTTVVPYNLFLHASLVSEKWKHTSDLKYAKRDTLLAVVLGGIVSMCIIISAAAVENMQINSASDLAQGLEPLFGSYSKYFLSIGLFAAGITSAITAPLAAAYVACGCLGWPTKLKSAKFRSVWIFILIVGVLLSSTGLKSIEIIKFAQFANGLLLPVIAGFLIWIMNKKNLLGKYSNSKFQNILAISIVLITIILGLRSILKVLEIL
ncbi:NRAMP (natural resistance-associated macrophage protein) metal ion transporters [Flavobacteriaceae bacterium MAR_2010_188]|nr:NRAMP (natural resistance-associated macrophage protein) metal ion transporters [Flavobacteriaceae bacterium MAR_2010_188]